MRERKGRRLGLLFIAAAVVGALLASAAWAQEDPAVSIGSGAVEPGGEVSVELESLNVGEPGLGAWSIDITYDPDVVTPVECDTEHGAVCNTEFDDDTIRTAGATAVGIEGDTLLATITFECGDEEGESPLTISLPDFADATIGGPQQIDADIVDGTITCGDAPTPPPSLAPTGTGGSAGSDASLLIGLLAAAGLAALGVGALAVRSRI
jgi:hypothetical protein